MTRQQLVRSLVLVAAGAISAPAAAENYLSLSVGESKVQDFNPEDLAFDGSTVSNARAEDTDTSFRVALGFAASDTFTFEVGYLDLGEVTADGTSDGTGFFWAPGPVNITTAVDGYDFGLVGRVPMSETFALFGRVGLFMWDLEATARDSAGSLSGTEDGDDPYFGLGAEFSMSPSVSFRGEFVRYSVDESDIDTLSLSAILRFED